MPSDELITPAALTELTLGADQTGFTDQQVTALRHIGVEDASPADLEVFFHVVKRTGLDPFARQIHMIGRRGKDGVKQTIQTGIDGYRLIGRRAADKAREPIAVRPVEWAHRDGGWRDVWSAEWDVPLAARVTIVRGGQEFTATALFDEYAQRKRDGALTSMWAQRPAGQIAKCAEALAWRMAFPQDLAGVYVDEEMHQAANPGRTIEPAPARVSASDFAPTTAKEHPNVDEPDEASLNRMFALLRDVGCADRGSALAYVNDVLQLAEPITSRTQLTAAQVAAVLAELDTEVQRQGGAGE